MTINDLNHGESGIITKVDGEGVLRDRLLDMGLTPRTNVYLRKCAPMGDPLEISLRGYELTIRKEDASKIHINKLDLLQQPLGSCSGNCRDCYSEIKSSESKTTNISDTSKRDNKNNRKNTRNA